MPRVTGILETAIHVRDLTVATAFYHGLLGFDVMFQDDRLCALNVAGRDVLLLFREHASAAATEIPGGIIPPHDTAGTHHFAFSVEKAELPAWERHLAANSVPIESRVHWDRGGVSLYFRDPDGHLVELATPGIWPIY